MVVAVVVTKLSDHSCARQVISEICILERMSHTNVIKLLDVYCMGRATRLIFEHGGRSLRQVLHSLGAQDVSIVQNLMRQLLRAVAYIHGHDVIHNDLKPSNVLLDDGSVLRVADFGSSTIDRVGWRFLPSELTIQKKGLREMTAWYRAPEVILGNASYARSVDLWSSGCIMSELVRARPLFNFGEIATEQMIGQIYATVGKPSNAVLNDHTRILF